MDERWIAGLGILTLTSCVSTSGAKKLPQSELKQDIVANDAEASPAALWFSGSMEQAFAFARETNRPIFLYWGAVWCPPCHELKANVLGTEEFKRAMQDFVPVYLDGDSAEAQLWGERFHISGYPTLLILSSDRQERLRLHSGFQKEEFLAAIQAIVEGDRSIREVLQRLVQGNLDTNDWRILAATDWEQLPTGSLGPDPAAETALLAKAYAECPAELLREKARLAAQWMRKAAEGKKGTFSVQQVHALHEALLFLLQHDDAIEAARDFLSFEVKATHLAWMESLSRKERRAIRIAWLAAADRNYQALNLSAESRLTSLLPHLMFYRIEHPQGPLPKVLKERVRKTVNAFQADLKSGTERHALITTAAYVLRMAEEPDAARKLLMAELTQSQTPWYLFGSLARLEEDLGNQTQAFVWSAKARESVKGRASRLQWIADDILLNVRHASRERRTYLMDLIGAYYALATELEDGFLGRNGLRAIKLQKALADLAREEDVRALLIRLAAKCVRLPKEGQGACDKHFTSLIGP